MINGVFDVTMTQYENIKAGLMGSADTYTGEASGQLITDDASFYVVIGTALGAPRDAMVEISNPDWFDDELTTFYWFEDPQGHQRYQQYVLAITHPDSVTLSGGWDWRGLLQDVADFWGDEVVRCTVEGELRGFAVYLVR
ncbi:MAG: hypothetical protein FWF75_03110 [Propionibacteriaceae bacterium]|nr:hypothetical protein [Propionibacteriaceae bacterium]